MLSGLKEPKNAAARIFAWNVGDMLRSRRAMDALRREGLPPIIGHILE
jgi:hypothetical protein